MLWWPRINFNDSCENRDLRWPLLNDTAHTCWLLCPGSWHESSYIDNNQQTSERKQISDSTFNCFWCELSVINKLLVGKIFRRKKSRKLDENSSLNQSCRRTRISCAMKWIVSNADRYWTCEKRRQAEPSTRASRMKEKKKSISNKSFECSRKMFQTTRSQSGCWCLRRINPLQATRTLTHTLVFIVWTILSVHRKKNFPSDLQAFMMVR